MNNTNVLGVYNLDATKQIYLYDVLQGKDTKVVASDNFSGKPKRIYKLYTNREGVYFNYRGTKVYLHTINKVH